jgi:hypothetical protein
MAWISLRQAVSDERRGDEYDQLNFRRRAELTGFPQRDVQRGVHLGW